MQVFLKENLNFFFAQPFGRLKKDSTFAPGEMAEWSNAAVLKTVVRSRGPGVRIPLSPPKTKVEIPSFFCLLPVDKYFEFFHYNLDHTK